MIRVQYKMADVFAALEVCSVPFLKHFPRIDCNCATAFGDVHKLTSHRGSIVRHLIRPCFLLLFQTLIFPKTEHSIVRAKSWIRYGPLP